jgi:hypothetical protein
LSGKRTVPAGFRLVSFCSAWRSPTRWAGTVGRAGSSAPRRRCGGVVGGAGHPLDHGGQSGPQVRSSNVSGCTRRRPWIWTPPMSRSTGAGSSGGLRPGRAACRPVAPGDLGRGRPDGRGGAVGRQRRCPAPGRGDAAPRWAGSPSRCGSRRLPTTGCGSAPMPATSPPTSPGSPSTQVAAVENAPAGWPDDSYTIVRRVRVEAEAIPADPRSRRRRTDIEDPRGQARRRTASPALRAPSSQHGVDVSSAAGRKPLDPAPSPDRHRRRWARARRGASPRTVVRPGPAGPPGPPPHPRAATRKPPAHRAHRIRELDTAA